MEQYPDQAQFPYQLGEARCRKGAFDEAVSAYELAVRLDPALSAAVQQARETIAGASGGD